MSLLLVTPLVCLLYGIAGALWPQRVVGARTRDLTRWEA